MVQCKAITRKGTRCQAAVMAGHEYCFFHHVDPTTGKQLSEPRPIDRAVEVRILEETLRSVRKQPPSNEKARTLMQLIDMLEQLRKPEEKATPWKPPAL